jgi:glycosyltransferase involved in cell wall biosynthesis
VVHRINECDERKGTRTMNVQLRLANYCADHTVFIASWLKRLNVWRGEGSSSVILNGADEAIFRRASARIWDGREPLRIVTHHWGAHANKGWDAYRRLDALIGEEAWRGRIAFTYIGNLPASEQLRHGVAQAPLDGDALASTLADHHVYLTASVNEPAGMHHVEGALVGLPLIYRESGALPEYCGGFGEAFRGAEDMVDALARMAANYPQWKQAIAGYSRTADRMTDAYVDLFEKLHEARGEIAAARRPWRNPVAALLTRAVL